MNRYIGFDNYDAVKDEILADNQERLDQLVQGQNVETILDWQAHPYQGVASQAEALSAVLIVMMMSEHHALSDLLHKGDDWHLLREAPCPVLLLSRMEHPFRSVVAAVDCLKDSEHTQALNARVLDEARALADTMKLPLSVISVMPDPGYAYGELAASKLIVEYRSHAESVVREAQNQLLARLGVTAERQIVAVGAVERELEKAVEDAGILVIGTIANKGWKGFFIGNTAERLLTRAKGDMLVVN